MKNPNGKPALLGYGALAVLIFIYFLVTRC